MEARKKSGSLITAQAGLDQGKEIYALPGRITDALSEGCNQLIASGAFVLLSPSCVLENMGIFCEKREDLGEKNQKGLAKREKWCIVAWIPNRSIWRRSQNGQAFRSASLWMRS